MTIQTRTKQRRQAERVHTQSPLSAVRINDCEEAVLKNISKNGLCCTTHTLIPEMTQVVLTIRLPALPQEEVDYYSFKSHGAVVRCDPVVKTNSRLKWEIGIFFTEMDDRSADVLARYISRRRQRDESY